MTLFTATLPVATAKLAQLFESKSPALLRHFYLSGGTALSLQLGHRESEDLDFFATEVFDPITLQSQLTTFGELSDATLAEGTLNANLAGVKLQFLHYPYPLLESYVPFGAINLSSVLDIALTKLQTIGMRGSRKDFLDLYIILESYSLQELIDKLPAKYPGIDYNLPHILKSLVYFVDAEKEPMPRLHRDIQWDAVKDTISTAVTSLHLLKS